MRRWLINQANNNHLPVARIPLITLIHNDVLGEFWIIRTHIILPLPGHQLPNQAFITSFYHFDNSALYSPAMISLAGTHDDLVTWQYQAHFVAVQIDVVGLGANPSKAIGVTNDFSSYKVFVAGVDYFFLARQIVQLVLTLSCILTSRGKTR